MKIRSLNFEAYSPGNRRQDLQERLIPQRAEAFPQGKRSGDPYERDGRCEESYSPPANGVPPRERPFPTLRASDLRGMLPPPVA
jgi:hypothetical protein